MTMKIKHTIAVRSGVVAILMAACTMGASSKPVVSGGLDHTRVEARVRKELITLPYYGVFDFLAFRTNGGTVTLYGQVTRPTLRHDAENRVAKIEGIDRIENNIQVLPVSPFDDTIRRRAYRAVFGTGGLYRYSLGASPSIHIIVNRGHVTLEGVVATRMDSQLAHMAASRVPGVFSVTNNLLVEGEPARA